MAISFSGAHPRSVVSPQMDHHPPPFQGDGEGGSQGLSPHAATGGESPGSAPPQDKSGGMDGGTERNMTGLLMRQSSQDRPSPPQGIPLHPHNQGGFPNMPPGHAGPRVPMRPGLLPPPHPPMSANLPPGEMNRPPMFGGPHMARAEFNRPPGSGGATPPPRTPPGEVSRPSGMGDPSALNRPPAGEVGPPPTRPPGDLSRPPGDLSRPPGPGDVRPPRMGGAPMDSSGPRFRGPRGFPPMDGPPAGFLNGPRPLMKGAPFPFPQVRAIQ